MDQREEQPMPELQPIIKKQEYFKVSVSPFEGPREYEGAWKIIHISVGPKFENSLLRSSGSILPLKIRGFGTNSPFICTRINPSIARRHSL